MKYTILINQFAAVNSGLDLDLIDLSIFDFVKDFANSNGCIKMQTPEGVYFWISHKLIIEAMPLLKIKTPQGIIKRIDNLIKAGLLAKHVNCEHYSKTLYAFGKNYDLLTFEKQTFGTPKQELTPLNESLAPPSTLVVPPLNESLGNNNNIYNYNNNNSNNTEKDFSVSHDQNLFGGLEVKQPGPEEKKEVAQRKTLFKNSDLYKLVNFETNDYSDFENLYSSEEFRPIDLVYYFNVVCDWSDQKNMKRTKAGWIATIRTFIRGDAEKNKTRLKPEFQTVKQKLDVNGAIDFLNNFD